MRFRDYLPDRGTARARFLTSQGVSRRSVDDFLLCPMAAVREAPPRRRSFPLVVFGQGKDEDAADLAVLAEFLTSHGWIVASVPSPMIARPMTDESQIGAYAERQADAMARARSLVKHTFEVQGGDYALVAHSFGARAALLLAMRDPHVSAIVSLDGGIGSANGVAEMRAAPSFRAATLLPPLLHVYERLDPFMSVDFKTIDSLHFRRRKIEQVSAMHHIHFSTYGFAAARFDEFAKATHAVPSTAKEVAAVANECLRFLASSKS